MEVTEDGKNTGTCYSPNEKIALYISKYNPHRETALNGKIALFLSKKSAERVLKRIKVSGFAVFGVTREHLIGICHMVEEGNWSFAIAGTLGFGPNGELLMFEHSYDEILDHFDMK